ncbi:uncharacterized protein F4807DRAFT_65622 [Annulohypoxylon truncatum]|uniref:uncharacterized protein n=1 Tax=Annulohypoxylon truncatum TaxID=327061 RepID=UPI0020085BDD|nr:uncharacterized protein F4807DRAFT_65622 [Annulohypoxylon truncatum]KAI1210420.1 hypothetical protein F4807DRAFT_65622 [Annulohypoxylon truncatum]
MSPHAAESPAKKQSKWTQEENDLITKLRGNGMKWDDISKRLPGRSAISCRLHYQNYLEKRSWWDEEKKNKLARLYERLKHEMWIKVSQEMGIPWRTAEAMHWQLGEQDIQRRAGVAQPFVMSPVTTDEPHGGPRISTRHAHSHSHSHSQGGLSRNVTPGPGRGYERGEPSTSSRPLASRRESIPRHVPVYPEHVPESYGYHQHTPMPLAPIKTESQPPLPGMLPGVAELTTGVSPYNTMAYSIPSPSPGPNTAPSSWTTHMGFPPTPEPTGSKRRRSPETSHHLSPDLRRRHLDPRQ